VKLCGFGLLIALGLFPPALFATPFLNKGTSIQGAIAYRDDSDPTQFHYLPLSTSSVLGDRLKTFEVKYFGVGKPFLVRQANGSITSRAGAIVSGTFVIDLSAAQRAQLIAQISKDFGVANPKLLPIKIREPKLQSIVLEKIDGFGDTVEQQWASGFAIGADSGFSVGSMNSGFAQIVASLSPGGTPATIPVNPAIGVNISGNAEFVGEPWTASIDCDLHQVWKEVRSKVNVSASIGWFRIGGASYNNIAKELEKSGACKFDMKEGTLDNEKFGRQVLDMTKKMFEEMNKSAVAGEAFFKFEPNPDAPDAGGGEGGPNLFGFAVSLNGGYGSTSFRQGIKWNTTVSYTGHVSVGLNLGTALAVSCSDATKGFFVDLNDASQPCITQDKIDIFQDRLKKEAKAKSAAYKKVNDQLLSNSITIEQYDKLKAAIDQLVFTDDTYAIAGATQQALGVVPVLSSQRVNTTIFSLGKQRDSIIALDPDETSKFFKIDPNKTLLRIESGIAGGER
jgi:hypothetical protein